MRAWWLRMWSWVLQYDHTETQLPSRSCHGDIENFINMVLFIGCASCIWKGQGCLSIWRSISRVWKPWFGFCAIFRSTAIKVQRHIYCSSFITILQRAQIGLPNYILSLCLIFYIVLWLHLVVKLAFGWFFYYSFVIEYNSSYWVSIISVMCFNTSHRTWVKCSINPTACCSMLYVIWLY